MELVDYFFWELVFLFLGPQDLVAVSGVCYSWWGFVFRGRRSTQHVLRNCSVLDVSNSGKLYQKVPLQLFGQLKKLSLNGTPITSKNFIKLTAVAKQLRTLEIANCENISEEAIFRAKYNLQRLRSVNISYNPQFSVLAIACLCSCESIVDICFCGTKLEEKELLFLSKTFSRLPNGGISLRSGELDGDYVFDSADSDEDAEDYFSQFIP